MQADFAIIKEIASPAADVVRHADLRLNSRNARAGDLKRREIDTEDACARGRAGTDAGVDPVARVWIRYEDAEFARIVVGRRWQDLDDLAPLVEPNPGRSKRCSGKRHTRGRDGFTDDAIDLSIGAESHRSEESMCVEPLDQLEGLRMYAQLNVTKLVADISLVRHRGEWGVCKRRFGSERRSSRRIPRTEERGAREHDSEETRDVQPTRSGAGARRLCVGFYLPPKDFPLKDFPP